MADDGWLHTGDLGRFDDRGRLEIIGRKADTIVTGGENVAPTEVEAALLEHPAVADAAVHPRVDPEWGEAVVATVVLRDGADRGGRRPARPLRGAAGGVQGAQGGGVRRWPAAHRIGQAAAPPALIGGVSSATRFEESESPNQLTIEQLAAQSGMSVRNIRAHQARGLLDPPEVRARVGYYGPEHLAQLRLVRELQDDGFNLGGIKRLLDDTQGTAERLQRFGEALSAAAVASAARR